MTYTVHILSDSLGETAEMVARAAIAQFDGDAFRIERLPRVRTVGELRTAVRSHCGQWCLFVYTLVDDALRREMETLCASGVNGIDVLGPAVATIGRVTGLQPSGEPGAIRRTDEEYFERIEAMEFAVKHDDGRNPQDLPEADVVLIGVSRSSKTPLAMYLAFKGYRAANVPLTPGTDPPKELFEVSPRRVFGLITSARVLREVRTERMRELGTYVPGYADLEAIERELEEARAVMRKIGCIVVHTDNRAIEEAAQEIVRHLEGGLTVSD
ncbi:kinase/pyrophosphorylase [Coriobacteriia bacterium Es71-Z0120]|uniref:pyruvate, water dikinase regulatory protein n=1 Tax=Parvivirga hydrogeniphila TaxID=2939460 RepID=UPI00226082DC|nr:pyruvate, water dikinase regulatory protein [Parvivirga hydrogeniphila]MCL4079003.1 kinase/pyrophosphorylase [Parvivirga hydrogeniphila]